MKILVVDRDTLTTQLLRSRLETMGHIVVEEPVKNNALLLLEKDQFDVILFDPAPLSNPRPIILGIRRSSRNYPYLILLTHDMSREEALKAGANDVLVKPLDGAHLDVMMQNARRLTSLIERLGDESEDFPSAGGVIAKSAFNQLFLSGIDRADRYAERSFMLFISIDNRDEIIQTEGPYAAEYATAKLSQYLVRLRRQSDIIAQTGKSEYCLLLQRPQYETEPKEAANRFAEALNRLEDICASKDSSVKVAVRLIDIPVATLHAEHIIEYGEKAAQTAG